MITDGLHFDLIVIGGGSAGMASAIQGAQCGLKVIVFDASGIDFDKPCGEGLMSPAISSLSGLGIVLSESYRLTGIKYFTSPEGSAFAPFSKDALALGVRRRVLRRAMWQRALELGVHIQETVVEKIDVSRNEIHVNGIKGDYLCVATGANNRILKQIGLADPRKSNEKPMRIGLRRHIRMAPWSDCVEVYWRDSAELYVTPVSDHCINIAILSWHSLGFEDAMNLFPEVQNKLKDAPWEDQPAGRGPLSHRASRVQKGRVFIAGDAAMFIDAMTGEGNTLAIRSGIAVSKAIAKGRPYLYRFYWISIVWRYWIVTAPVLWMSQHISLKRSLLKVIVRYPILLRFGVRFLSADGRKAGLSGYQVGAQ